MSNTEALSGIILAAMGFMGAFVILAGLYHGVRWIFTRKKKPKHQFPELYKSIKKLPLHNWEQMQVNNDPLWLVVDQSERDRKLPKGALTEAYFSLYDEYADATGLHEVMDKWRNLMIMRLEARAEIADGDLAAQNRVDIYTHQIEQIMRSSGDSDAIKNRILVQQAYGQPLKPTEITLYEYLMVRKLLEEQAARSKTPTDNGETD